MFTNTFQLPNHSSLLELPTKNDVYQYFQIPKPQYSLQKRMFKNTFNPPDQIAIPLYPWSVSSTTLYTCNLEITIYYNSCGFGFLNIIL